MGNKNIKYKVRTFFRLKELELGKDKFWLFEIFVHHMCTLQKCFKNNLYPIFVWCETAEQKYNII